MLEVIVDVNRAFGRYYAGPRTDVFIFAGEPCNGHGYLVQFDPETGTVTAAASFN